MQGIAWSMVGLAFGIAIAAPPPAPREPDPPRYFTPAQRETMEGYCRRYPASYFDRCMARKAADWHVVR